MILKDQTLQVASSHHGKTKYQLQEQCLLEGLMKIRRLKNSRILLDGQGDILFTKNPLLGRNLNFENWHFCILYKKPSIKHRIEATIRFFKIIFNFIWKD